MLAIGASAARRDPAAAVTAVGARGRRPLRMILALAWCGLIAAAGTAAGIYLCIVAVRMDDPMGLFAPVIALFGILQLVPAVLLLVGLKRLYRCPPCGMWLAVSGLCCYAAEGLVPLLIIIPAPHTFWELVQWFGLPGWALLGSALLVVWAVRASPVTQP
jgi:hypothetical protein